ncbi:MAG: phosphate ABC transporter permease PstA [Actinomycetes bacterium]
MTVQGVAPSRIGRPRPRVRTSGLTVDNLAPLAAALTGSLATTWLLFEQLLPMSGTIGFWLCWYAVFLGLYVLITATTRDWQTVKDRVATVIFTTGGIVLVTALVLVVAFTAIRGFEAVIHSNFFTETTAMTGPDDPLDKGGVYAAMIGTLEQVAISILITVPLGFATAIYLNESRAGFARVVRTVVDAMTAIPTIVAGLFIFAVVILTLGFERSGFAAALALSVEMLPVVTRTSEIVLRLVPGGLREASYAMGASQWRTLSRVILPTARAGLITAVLLGVARVVGETSPVLLTAGFTNELNYNATDGPQVSLPLFVFTQVRYPLDNAIARAFGAALVLLLLVLILFTTARIVGGRPVGQPSRRALRRLRRVREEAS